MICDIVLENLNGQLKWASYFRLQVAVQRIANVQQVKYVPKSYFPKDGQRDGPMDQRTNGPSNKWIMPLTLNASKTRPDTRLPQSRLGGQGQDGESQ